jgi:hypothetical protein
VAGPRLGSVHRGGQSTMCGPALGCPRLPSDDRAHQRMNARASGHPWPLPWSAIGRGCRGCVASALEGQLSSGLDAQVLVPHPAGNAQKGAL